MRTREFKLSFQVSEGFFSFCSLFFLFLVQLLKSEKWTRRVEVIWILSQCVNSSTIAVRATVVGKQSERNT